MPIITLVSWVGSIYDSNINSLLDADGIRWGVSHIMSNYARLPLTLLITLLISVSVAIESGWTDWMYKKNHPLMLKQLRAYTYTNLLLLFLVIVFVLMLILPVSPFLNAFGELDHSPLAVGWPMLLSLLVILVSNIYGFLSGRLTTQVDFINAHTYLLRKYSYAFLSLFVVAQICGSIDYCNLLFFTAPTIDKAIMTLLVILCFVG